MPKYMLLLHDDPPSFADASPDEMQSIVEEYVAWRRSLEEQGRLVGGEKLADEGGRILTANGAGVHVVDGPFAEAKEVLGGYFTIEASSYDEAIEISKGCPHLKYGERIELREIDSHTQE